MFQGILDAMKNKEKLQRSKSETNLKSTSIVTVVESSGRSVSEGEGESEEMSSRTHCTPASRCRRLDVSGAELSKAGARPKSWSPDHGVANTLFSTTPG